MSNNPANNNWWNNTPGISNDDYDEYYFEDIDHGVLFWLSVNDRGTVQEMHRKINDFEAMDMKTRQSVTFNKHKKVYVRL